MERSRCGCFQRESPGLGIITLATNATVQRVVFQRCAQSFEWLQVPGPVSAEVVDVCRGAIEDAWEGEIGSEVVVPQRLRARALGLMGLPALAVGDWPSKCRPLNRQHATGGCGVWLMCCRDCDPGAGRPTA